MSSARLIRSADPHPKILDLHREKLAVIYVRQSVRLPEAGFDGGLARSGNRIN